MLRTTGSIMQNAKQEMKRKDTSTPLLSAINPKIGAMTAKDILNTNPQVSKIMMIMTILMMMIKIIPRTS